MSIFKPSTRFLGITDRPHIMPLNIYESYGLIKQAAQDMHPDIDAYIKKARPIPGKNILLIDALGAGEVWGGNVNADYFSREELMREDSNAGYRSFMNFAYPYKHHQNEAGKKDPSRRYGEKVVLSRYFRPMDRVQLIIIVDSSPGRADDVVTQCDNGAHPDVSMACGVAYDQCSICGRIHRTKKDYCWHALNELGKIYSNGERQQLFNFRPRFHDLSFVFIGAEPSAKVLCKIAAAGYTYDLSRLSKSSDIEKEITPESEQIKIRKIAKIADIADKYFDGVGDFARGDPSINPLVLQLLAQQPIGDVVSTLNQLAIPLRPREFQYLMLCAGGNKAKADELQQQGLCFSDAASDTTAKDIAEVELPDGDFNREVAKVAMNIVDDRSGHLPFIMARLYNRCLNKQAAIPAFKPASFIWPLMGGMFMAYKRKLPKDLTKIIAKGAKEISPYVTPVAAGTALHMAVSMGRSLVAPDNGYQDNWAADNFMDYDLLDNEDNGDNNSGFGDFSIDDTSILDKISSIPAMAYGIGAVPLMYMYSSFARKKADDVPHAWEGMGPVNKFVAKHPDASSLLALLTVPTVVRTLRADTSLFKKLGS